MPDFVRVVNTDVKPFFYHHKDAKKSIPAGRESMMPWPLAVTLFGDPFAIDAEKKPDRKDSLRRARAVFNYELGMESDEAFMARIPKFEVYDTETNQRIYMLIEDPDGEHADEYVPMDIESNDTVGLLTQQIKMMQEQIGKLIAMQTNQAPAMASGQTSTPSGDAPESPEIPRVDWIGGNPFAQREDDAAATPLWDFAAVSQVSADETPSWADIPVPNPVVNDGMPIVADLPIAAIIAASDALNTLDAPSEDAPQDAGVGSRRASGRLAPKK